MARLVLAFFFGNNAVSFCMKENLPPIWKDIFVYYKEYSTNWLDDAPMVELVEHIASSDYASIFYPYTSIGSLCISAEADFDKQGKFDVLCITYRSDLKMFWVRYYDAFLKKEEKSKCEVKQIIPVVECFLLRMKIQYQNKV